jgi:hypothetical protein
VLIVTDGATGEYWPPHDQWGEVDRAILHGLHLTVITKSQAPKTFSLSPWVRIGYPGRWKREVRAFGPDQTLAGASSD